MDQVQIGRFIAEERKMKGFTQRQLADRLEISDKTVSKWERGNGMPEVSLLMPLCEELGISVNELLSGQRLDDISYKKKAEENMVSIMKEKEENKKKLQTAFLMGLISTVAFITLILVVAYYAEVIALPVKLLLVTVACAIFGVGLYVVMHTEWTVGYYRCQCCGHHFVPTFFEYQKSMHLCTTRRLKCPECGRKSWCKKVLTREK